jgi:hypothetical protein
MKLFISLLIIATTTFTFSQDEFIQKIDDAKQSLRDQMDTLKYDGSTVTYFKYRDQTYYKGVQVPVFLRDNYIFLLSGETAEDKVSVQFYDKPPESDNRLLLYEIKNISGDEEIVNVADLRERMTVYGKSPGLLKNIFIDYEIKKSRANRGAIVLVLGY